MIIMNKSLILLILVSISLTTSAQIRVSHDPRPAKEIVFPVLDTTVLRLRYQMTWVPDTLKPDETRENTMMLQVGHTISKWSDYHLYLADSIWNEMARQKKAHSVVLNRTLPMEINTIPIRIFMNHPKGRTTT